MQKYTQMLWTSYIDTYRRLYLEMYKFGIKSFNKDLLNYFALSNLDNW